MDQRLPLHKRATGIGCSTRVPRRLRLSLPPPGRSSCGAGSARTACRFWNPLFWWTPRPRCLILWANTRSPGRTNGGSELFSLDFTMPETADGDGSSSFALVLPARPGWEGNLASITLTGPGGSFTLDRESDQPVAILRNPRNGQVRGILRDLPPPAQAAMDAAGRAAAPGLEVLFSRGIPDSAAWRR